MTEEEYKKYLTQIGYTPINAAAAPGISKEAYRDQVNAQKGYIAAHPTATQTYTREEYDSLYGDIAGGVVDSGLYTHDAAHAQAAVKDGLNVEETTYNGKQAWLIHERERTGQEGSSQADEGNLSDADYAVVQSLKQDFAAAQANYNAAVAAGDTALAARYQQAMDDAHLSAERIRANYRYSGGTDGSMYIPYGNLGVDEGSSGSGSSGSGSSGGYASSGSSGGSLSGYVEDYSAYLQQMYAAQKAEALARLKEAYDSNVAALDRAGEGLGADYRNARNLTAGTNAVERRNFAEYAAANGLNSGTAGQAELARSVTLQNDLNTINTAEADAVAGLRLQRSQAEIEYNNAIAQAEAQGDYELASALYKEKVRVQEALIDAEIRQQEFALEQYRLEYQARQDAVTNRLNADKFAFQQQQYYDGLAADEASALARYGESCLKQGILPSDAMLAAMGITAADAQAYLAASGKGGSSSSSASSSASSSGAEDGAQEVQGAAAFDPLLIAFYTAARESRNPQAFIANNYKQYGINSNSGLYSDYQKWAEWVDYQDIQTYEQARSRILAAAKSAKGLMTQMEWIRHKNSTTTREEGNYVKEYDTYEEYLQAFTKAMLES